MKLQMRCRFYSKGTGDRLTNEMIANFELTNTIVMSIQRGRLPKVERERVVLWQDEEEIDVL
jgi:hypothetical protein